MAQIANRTAMRTATVGIELDSNVESLRSIELAAVPEAESTATGTPVPSEADMAARQDQSNRPARKLTETPPGPLRIKKNKEKVKPRGPYARPSAASEVATNKAKKPLPGQHRRRDGLRKRGTQVDFTRVIENNLQYTSSAPQEVPSSAEGIQILFKARNERGEWEKVVHKLVVDLANLSSVERVAKEDARNQKATFYDKDLRIITPAQCFDIAIEDKVNTIFVTYGKELSVNEETIALVSRSLDKDRDRAKQYRG